jgi:CelD/BcsL family acetyltransferase involved in cellulose biosynthesis
VIARPHVADSPERSLVLAPGDRRWRELVVGHPEALPFHHPEWLATLTDCYGFAPLIVAVTDAAGEVIGGLPLMQMTDPWRGRRWIALPFTDRCPPLVATDDALPPLLRALASVAAAHGVGRLEIRAGAPGFQNVEVAKTHLLDLTRGGEAVERAFRSAHRRNASKALRAGVTLRRAKSEEDVAGAYYALHLLTRRRLGVPVQPRRFFRLLWRRVLAPGLGHVLLASADGSPIAGAVFLHAGATVIYKYGASDARAWSLRANNLLFAEAIRWSAEAGYSRFDFGRSDHEDTGLRSFKSGWGAVEEPLVYAFAGSAPGRPTRSGRTAGRLLAAVVRRSPVLLCRAAGETLYRYAA